LKLSDNYLCKVEEFKHEADLDSCDASEQVDDDETDVGNAWLREQEAGRVHQGCHGPAGS